MDPQSVEELFERNADMRLLELRHSEHGRGPSSLREANTRFRSESVEPDDQPVIDPAPRLRVTIAAAPNKGVIAGAVVGIAIDVFNDGTAPAPETTLLLSLPIEAEYRSGTLRIDGRETAGPEQLFRTGLRVARLPGQTSLKVTFQMAVLPGIGALYLQPRLQAQGVSVVGTGGISIKRKAIGAALPEAEKPFYELTPADDDIVESDRTDAILPPVDAAGSRVADPPPKPAPPKPAAPKPAAPKPAPKPVAPKSVPAKPVPAPAAIAEPKAEPVAAPPKVPPAPKTVVAEAAPAEAVDRMTCVRTLRAADITMLSRLFGATSPGIVGHAMLISTIACSEVPGEAASALETFLAYDVAALARVLVLFRMGKPLTFPVDQATLSSLTFPWTSAPHLPAGKREPRRLRRDLRAAEYAAMTGLFQPSERDPNLRLRIALLALAGASVDGVDAKTAQECMVALAGYRSAALAWLVPLCVASSLGAPAPAEPPATLDLAGKRLVRALATAFPE